MALRSKSTSKSKSVETVEPDEPSPETAVDMLALALDDEDFGLEGVDDLLDDEEGGGLDVKSMGDLSGHHAQLPPQLPAASRRERRRFKEQGNKDQLPARRPSTSELLIADELSRYLSEVRRYPLLERKEEQRLAEQYFEEGDREAAKQLVTGNLRLVVKIAKQYRRAWVNIMDLIQEGNIGLGEAVKRFDPYRGVRFSSFARYWIRALILQFILKNFRMISFANTRAGRKLFFRLEKEKARLMSLYGEATTAQLALALEVSEEDVESAILLNQPMLSLDMPRFQGEGDQGDTLAGMIKDDRELVDDGYANQDFRDILNGHIQSFGDSITDERERTIWRERLLNDEPVALSALGERFDVSRERVRQIEQRIKKRLKEHLSEAMGSEIILGQESED
jgi:RNA polymerase sigma-32 factor